MYSTQNYEHKVKITNIFPLKIICNTVSVKMPIMNNYVLNKYFFNYCIIITHIESFVLNKWWVFTTNLKVQCKPIVVETIVADCPR